VTIEDYRRLRDAYGLERYAESLAAHDRRLTALEDPAQRHRLFAEWGSLSTKERGALVRAAIAYERGEIERVTRLYEELEAFEDARG